MLLSFLFTLIKFIFIIYQGTASNDFSHLTEAGVASMLSIVITVWIGLNIYNVISKEDLDIFIEEQRNQIEAINEKSNGAISHLDTKTSIHKLLIMLEETMDKYVISYYFILKFANDNDNDEIHDVDSLVEIEYYFAKTTKHYEKNIYQASLNFNKKCIEKVYKYKQKDGTLDNKLVQVF